jgi:hypothetical protein
VADPNQIPPQHRQQAIYWNQLVHLKTVATYIRLYRDDHTQWINRVGILRAVATSSTIAGWVIWKDYAIVWGLVIAASQLADSLKDFLPNARRQKAASELAAILETLFIDAQFEWEIISSGTATRADTMTHYRKFAKLRLDAEKKYFPEGIPLHKKLYTLAVREASEYLSATYGEGPRE